MKTNFREKMNNIHLAPKPLLGDGMGIGLARFFILIVLPFGLLITNVVASWVYNFTFLPGQILLAYFFLMISAFATSVYYIKDIYNEPFDLIPFKYFMICFFGLITPRLHINREVEDSSWQDTVEKIGGPAYLDVDPGYIVVTESLTAPGKIYEKGKRQFMSRHERIYKIIDLHQQEGSIPLVKANSRDGLQVIVENIKFNYRIWDSRWDGLYKDPTVTRKPYPYSKQAVFNLIYKSPTQVNDQQEIVPMSWEEIVKGSVSGLIKGYVTNRNLDDIIAPHTSGDNTVRDEIRAQAYEPGFKEKMKDNGTYLHWWDPGEFSSQKDVEDQFYSNWSVKVNSEIKINKAHGTAQTMALDEMGRAEAEAELLMTIINAMDGINLKKDKIETLQNLILLRTAQVIKALNTKPDEELPKP